MGQIENFTENMKKLNEWVGMTEEEKCNKVKNRLFDLINFCTRFTNHPFTDELWKIYELTRKYISTINFKRNELSDEDYKFLIDKGFKNKINYSMDLEKVYQESLIKKESKDGI